MGMEFAQHKVEETGTSNMVLRALLNQLGKKEGQKQRRDMLTCGGPQVG